MPAFPKAVKCMADGGKVSVQGGGSTLHGKAKGYGAGARVGYEVPVSKDTIIGVGVSGSAHDVRGDWGRSRDAKVTGVDIALRKKF